MFQPHAPQQPQNHSQSHLTHKTNKTTHFVGDFLLFPEKEAKSVCSASRKKLATQLSAKPTQGVWGLAPKKLALLKPTRLDVSFFFQKKKQKA
jgi:hypothetical protein